MRSRPCRANDWPAPSLIFRTLGKSSYSYILQAPVSVAAIFMLREAYEEACKVRIALLAVLSARDVTNAESEISIRKDAGPEGNSLALGNVGLIDLKEPGLMARPRSVSRPKRVVSLKLLAMFMETAKLRWRSRPR